MFMHRSMDLVFRTRMGNGTGRALPFPRFELPVSPLLVIPEVTAPLTSYLPPNPSLTTWSATKSVRSVFLNHEFGIDLSPEWFSEHHRNQLVAADLVGLMSGEFPKVYLVQSAEALRFAQKNKAVSQLVDAVRLRSIVKTKYLKPSLRPIKQTPTPVSSIVFKIAPTVPFRPLDEFEGYALGRLRIGAALVRMEEDGRIRAMGAIRASQSCLRCHDGKAGDLLGALTYFIARTPDDSHTEDYSKMRAALRKEGSRGLSPFIRPLGLPDATGIEAFAWIAYQGFATLEMVAWQDTHAEERRLKSEGDELIGTLFRPRINFGAENFNLINFRNGPP